MAPRATLKFHARIYYLCKLIIYILAALVIWQKTSPVFGVLFIGLAIVDEALLYKHNLS